jgi:hypothetical protein
LEKKKKNKEEEEEEEKRGKKKRVAPILMSCLFTVFGLGYENPEGESRERKKKNEFKE